ncbi:MAG: adenosine deaminase [Bdellovibrionales bacterium GWA2_49_15]|nr:MAG: adenosine deaminase [Bdellovibrionales bacterium GWA2_49_15]HAZ13827.1 adenosine deaminase family protein [Bdellovibrionales bacterium]
MITEAFIKEMPKSDLHLHLDGSLRLTTLIDLANKDKVELPSYTEEGLRELVFKDKYGNLGEYLHGFMYTCSVLHKAENLERVAYELAIDNQKEGVRYIEIRYAPQLHVDNQAMTMKVVLESVNKGLARAEKEFNARPEVQSKEEPPFKYGIIACAMRMFGQSFSPYYGKLFSVHRYSESMEVIRMGALELAKAMVKIRDEQGIPIVGFDLAGQEAGYPASDFTAAYDYVHKNFMHKTVHAGEAYGAESIFEAITSLHADRLGHGYYLFDEDKISDPKIKDKTAYIKKLSSYIADQRITVEVCLTSNMQTNPEIRDIKNHTIKTMLDKKMSLVLCTDNRLISNTTVSKEIQLAVENFDINAKSLKDIVSYGFKRSFYPGDYSERRDYVRQMMGFYDKTAKKHAVL